MTRAGDDAGVSESLFRRLVCLGASVCLFVAAIVSDAWSKSSGWEREWTGQGDTTCKVAAEDGRTCRGAQVYCSDVGQISGNPVLEAC